MRLVDLTRKLLSLARAMRKWYGLLSALDDAHRDKIARFSERIAATLARAADAFDRIARNPADKAAKKAAIRELGRISGYVETIVGTLDGRVDGRRLAGIRRRLEPLVEDGLIAEAVRRADASRIERLLSSEGYFRALADALRAED